MRINNNMSAVITNNQLLGTEESLSDVMEKLSSGFSINHASDNPSGIAIAGKMQAQIDGLDQASTNSDDGISVLQTAEGALGEVTDMIQRMRELSVQAANGTNGDSERESIQMEIASLLEEIDRISTTTEFNTINLLDGSLDDRSYAEHCTRLQTSNTVAAGNYELTVNKAATTANITTDTTKLLDGTQSPAPTTTTVYDTGEKTKKITTTVTYTMDASKATDGFKAWIDGQSYTVNTLTTATYTLAGISGVSDTENGDGQTTSTSGTGLAVAGTITINGYEMSFDQGQSGESVYENLRIAAENGGAEISNPSEMLSLKSTKYGADATLDITFSSIEFAEALGFNKDQFTTNTDGSYNTTLNQVGTDADVTLTIPDGTTITEDQSMFGPQATVRYDGNHIIVSDTGGFEISFLAEEGFDATTDPDTENKGKISINVTDIGSMMLQVGANEGQQMKVRIKSVSTKYMYIDDVDVTKSDGADDAMDKLSDALDYVTEVRSQLGAYENRLDHTKSSLDETSENMTSAISRIEDADMATTMVEYTRLNVLDQAATSALAQANELPQLALQLLQ